jgi:hypothetical protein
VVKQPSQNYCLCFFCSKTKEVAGNFGSKKQAICLSDIANKKEFVNHLVTFLRRNGLNVQQSKEDADCDIVKKTLFTREQNANVTLVCKTLTC